MKSGIYIIECIGNNKKYIGSSINVDTRLKQHKSKLKKNKHDNPYLQNSYNKYGLSLFIFKSLENCLEPELLDLENKYILLFDTLNSKKGFNCLPAKRNDELRGNINYLKRLSDSMKGKMPKNYEQFRKQSARPILEYENDIFIKEYSSCKEAGEVLQICYKLINNVLTGKVKRVRKFPNKTWIYKDGFNTRDIKKVKRPKHSKKVLQFTYDNVLIAVFDSAFDAANKLKIPINTIRNSCNNRVERCITLKCLFEYE